MGKVLADSTIEYLTRADGQRTGVVLRWDEYQALRAYVPADPDMLVNLSEPELQVLANGMLSSAHQQRLSELLQHNRAQTIDSAAEAELDHLIEHVDYMNILKARAKYTLQRLAETKESYG